jgi:NAD(P) transhydrogenase
LTPTNAAVLKKKGFGKILVERNAGAAAQFPDEEYAAAGATLVTREELYESADIVLKVRPPQAGEEADSLKEGSTIISFLYPNQNKASVEALASRKANALAMDMIPRISRAQVFDALRQVSQLQFFNDSEVMMLFYSSMANIAGYKAVLEASNHFGRFLTGQVTAAG